MTLLNTTEAPAGENQTENLIPCESVCEYCAQHFVRHLPLEQIAHTYMRFCSRRHGILAAKGVIYMPIAEKPSPEQVPARPKPTPPKPSQTVKVKKPCPTPKKQAFSTFTLAIRRAIRVSGCYGHGMRPYKCGCGQYHLTSKRNRYWAK